MSNHDEVPRVAIVSGFFALAKQDPAKAKLAEEAATRLGEELAKAGFGIVVYYSDPGCLEPHVVSGFVAAVKDGSKLITVRCAQSQRGQVSFAEEATRSELFVRKVFAVSDWEAPFYRSLAEKEGVEGVVLMSGDKSTLIAGHIAAARQLPLLPIEAFGGSAAQIWSFLSLQNPSEPLPTWHSDREADLVADLRSRCETVRQSRRETEKQASIHRALTSRLTVVGCWALAFAMFVTALLYGTGGST